MLDVLRLDPLAEPWAEQAGAGDEYRDALGKLVDVTLEQRLLARARKDYRRPTLCGTGGDDRRRRGRPAGQGQRCRRPPARCRPCRSPGR
jgi:hypothetical protein